MNCVTRITQIIWGLYGWLCFILACLFSLVVALIVPGRHRRQRLITWATRMVFVLARVGVTVRGIDNLPRDSCVVVANHASYIDGILLNGYLPARFRFVIKGEMRNIPVVHFLLRRSGSKFVERKETSASSRDARQLVKAAQGGESLVFFPEGTFRLEPGVWRFRPGAFVAAVKGEMPVVPIAISGSREMMPSGRLLPRKADLIIDVLPAIAPGDEDFTSSRQLAEACRQRILAVLNEPDLI
ncbi:MAG: 1-acyl-sn-glycerol-3-phosphate acyltransferase [Proteobacteria bacterium]|nr:1-acyl-sn-glycerol-3-phosphate acyltransferase [Pseudomonadota bacterium]MCH9004719.1 1-acyl-sn-glycerol-3-phosphate acyltransferase [Pseudomonadota bacterium]